MELSEVLTDKINKDFDLKYGDTKSFNKRDMLEAYRDGAFIVAELVELEVEEVEEDDSDDIYNLFKKQQGIILFSFIITWLFIIFSSGKN